MFWVANFYFTKYQYQRTITYITSLVRLGKECVNIFFYEECKYGKKSDKPFFPFHDVMKVTMKPKISLLENKRFKEDRTRKLRNICTRAFKCKVLYFFTKEISYLSANSSSMAVRFGLVQKENGSRVPLESIKIKVDVQGFTAHVLATMKYSNKESNPIEAIFIFPLDEQAAVCGFQATIDGRTIVAEVQEKQEAQDTYDDAISSGHSAFLLEESDESSDIFQISVGNLPPEKEAVVELRFVTELAVESEGRVVFVLPTVLNPRYTPQDSAPSLSAQVPRVAAVSSPYAFEFEMKVKAISSISEISSTSNTLKVEINESDATQANITLAEAHKFDKDVEIHILTREPFKPQAIVERGVKTEGTEDEEGFMASPVVMLNFFPEFKTSESSEKGEFVFVVDRSGSMSGSKNDSARETLLLFLKSLPDGCYFNVVGFGSSYKTLFDKSVLYNDENLKKATDLAGSMKADLGGTEILSPLQWVFSQPLVKGHPRQLFLLTDGGVGNTQQVISLVQKHSNSARYAFLFFFI